MVFQEYLKDLILRLSIIVIYNIIPQLNTQCTDLKR
jgi:hypothetical protein